MLLTRENYNKGFLVDNEVIAGVTEMEGGIFAAYVSHYLTGETMAYREFDQLDPALAYLTTLSRPWLYEAVGCSKKTGASAKGSTCGTGGCGSCACGPK